MMRPALPTLSFDPREQIMFVGFAGLRLDSEQQVRAAFEEIRRFWTESCGGRKVYAIIDYTKFDLNIRLTEYYAGFVKEAVDTYSITTVRHTTDVLARATLRVVGLKIHRPSNLYATKEDAVEVVRALRAKAIALENSG
jgi:hypothetical protein